MSKTILVACAGCGRHVRSGELACPFCAAPLSAVAPPPRRAHRPLTRLALVAGVALAAPACGPTSSTPDDSIHEQESYGDEAPAEEAPDDDPVVQDEGAGEEAEESAPVALYGGPSIETIV